MANLTITAANVIQGSGAVTSTGVAGVSITAGQSVYLDTTDSKYKLADADLAASVNEAAIALHAAALDQPLTVQTGGTLAIGATVAVGTAYYVSATAGSICLESDLASGDFPYLLGYATAAGTITMMRRNFGVAKA
jgi:membrane-bound inhibitor of C-type lysozyme